MSGRTFRCDFHIHTALSPCADDDMTPNNIVNMAVLCGLDTIAVTDHNSCKNAAAVIAAARNANLPLLVIPGMEAESAEEIHVVCLFPNIEAAMLFDAYIEEGLPSIINRPDIFGRQLMMDENDAVTGELSSLLVTATRYGIDEVINKAKSLGGIAYPAHIDREANGIIAILGFIPPDTDINHIEISKSRDAPEYIKNGIGLDKYNYITASDAHRLWEIGENPWETVLPGDVSAENVINHLRGKPLRAGGVTT